MKIILKGALLLGLLYSSVSFAMVRHDIPSAGNDIIGENLMITTKKGDSLNKLARQYNVSFHELAEANPTIKLGRIKPDTPIIVPLQFLLPNAPRDGIVINLPELRLYYFDQANNAVYTYPIGIGRRGWRTPVASEAKVIGKQQDPAWHVPESIYWHVLETKGVELPEVVPPGPNNPLGRHAIRLSINGYLIHGTNAPRSVGKRVSSGCIRMMPNDIEDLYFRVKTGTPVHIVNQTHKAGWRDNQIYLETHRPLSDDMAADGAMPATLTETLALITDNPDQYVDWQLAQEVANQESGMPEYIGKERAIVFVTPQTTPADDAMIVAWFNERFDYSEALPNNISTQ